MPLTLWAFLVGLERNLFPTNFSPTHSSAGGGMGFPCSPAVQDLAGICVLHSMGFRESCWDTDLPGFPAQSWAKMCGGLQSDLAFGAGQPQHDTRMAVRLC